MSTERGDDSFDDDDFDDARRMWERERLVRSLTADREFFEMRIAEIDAAIATLRRRDRSEAERADPESP